MPYAPVNQAFKFRFSLWNGSAMVTGATVALSIQRLSDSKYWTGSAWQVSYTTVSGNMTELTGNISLEGKYSYTLSQAAISTTPDAFEFSSKYTSGNDIYNRETLYTYLPTLSDISAIKEQTDRMQFSGGDPPLILSALDGSGLTSDESDMLASIYGKLGATTVSVQSQVAANGTMTLVKGDDYYSTSALTLTRTAWPGESIVGGTVAFSLMTKAVYDAGTGAAALSGVACTFTNGATGSTIVVTVPLTAAQTAALTPSPAQNPLNYVYQIRATTAGGKIHTIFLGACTVKRAAN